jgi:hypothetical protein
VGPQIASLSRSIRTLAALERLLTGISVRAHVGPQIASLSRSIRTLAALERLLTGISVRAHVRLQ